MATLLLAAVLVRNASDNSVDHEASALAFSEALVTFEAEEIAERESKRGLFEAIDTALNATFDQYKGKAIASPVLSGMIMNQLYAGGLVTPDTHKYIAKDVLEYIQASSLDGGTLQTKKGPGMGVSRICDLPPPAKK